MSCVDRKCHRNESLYSVLELRHLVDINKYPSLPDEFGIKKQIEDLTKRIRYEHRSSKPITNYSPLLNWMLSLF